MRNLFRYLFAKKTHDKLPHLQNHLSTGYRPEDVNDNDAGLLMLAGLVKDPEGARRLMADYDAATAAELLDRLPRRRVNVRARFRRWLQTLEGSYTSDPHAKEYKAIMAEYRGMR